MNDRPPHLPSLQAAVNGGAKRVVIPSAGVACNECEVLMLVGLPGETKALLLKRNTPRVCALRTFKAVQSLSPCCTLCLHWEVVGCNVQPTSFGPHATFTFTYMPLLTVSALLHHTNHHCYCDALQGTGKTTWARQRAEKLPARRYMTLGTDLVMEQMKVGGSRRMVRWAGQG